MTAWASETLITTTLLALLVLILRRPVGRTFGARGAYALWLVPAVRFLLPPLPRTDSFAVELVPIPSAVAALPAAPAGSSTDWLLLAWLGGAAAMTCWRAAEHIMFMRRVLRSSRPVAEVRVAGVEVLESASIGGPLAVGLLRKRILLPRGYAREAGSAIARLAIEHELQHHRRGDLWAVTLAEALFALHWFNPVALFARRAFRFDLETACDADVIERLGDHERENYARTIVRCASAPTPATLCALTTVEDLKRRLIMLKTKHTSGRRIAGVAVASACAMAGLTLTTPAAAQEQKAEERVVIRTLTKGGDLTKEIEAMLKEREGGVEQCNNQSVKAAHEAADGKKIRVMLCGKKGATPAEQRGIIESAIERISSSEHLKSEEKATIVASLRSRLAQLQAN